MRGLIEALLQLLRLFLAPLQQVWLELSGAAARSELFPPDFYSRIAAIGPTPEVMAEITKDIDRTFPGKNCVHARVRDVTNATKNGRHMHSCKVFRIPPVPACPVQATPFSTLWTRWRGCVGCWGQSHSVIQTSGGLQPESCCFRPPTHALLPCERQSPSRPHFVSTGTANPSTLSRESCSCLQDPR